MGVALFIFFIFCFFLLIDVVCASFQFPTLCHFFPFLSISFHAAPKLHTQRVDLALEVPAVITQLHEVAGRRELGSLLGACQRQLFVGQALLFGLDLLCDLIDPCLLLGLSSRQLFSTVRAVGRMDERRDKCRQPAVEAALEKQRMI